MSIANLTDKISRPLSLSQKDNVWVGQFSAMASPCEILMVGVEKSIAEKLLTIAANEAWRIEQKYSRYRDDGIVTAINNSNGKPITVDDETAQLINYAYQCFELSDGLFDISSGILRKVWSFKDELPFPTRETINQYLPLIGLAKASWSVPDFSLPAGMQIDFGGIGKEYAVDRTLHLLLAEMDAPVLINFGGDIVCHHPIDQPYDWQVGIENPNQKNKASQLITLQKGALATSGSTQRYILHQGKRYSHVLNPKTGWPIEEPPLSITVAAGSCTEAGMLATFAMLQGVAAEEFLNQQAVQFWAFR